jgi:hypothetical protein
VVKIIVLFVLARRVALLEFAGASAVVGGVAAQWGGPAGWIAAGAAALVKSFELDLSAPAPDGDG